MKRCVLSKIGHLEKNLDVFVIRREHETLETYNGLLEKVSLDIK